MRKQALKQTEEMAAGITVHMFVTFKIKCFYYEGENTKSLMRAHLEVSDSYFLVSSGFFDFIALLASPLTS